MANVLQHPIDFHPRPVSHAPSSFGFGFALASSSAMAAAGWQPTSIPGHTNPAAFQQLASSVNQYSLARVQKRRHDFEDDPAGARDASMDRSPTPERPKRAAPKRARVQPQVDGSSKGDHDLKENKAPGGADDQDVDVGVLLASLPAQSLLPLLTSLLNAQPSLRATILPLIPRPTLDTATQALSHSAKKLRDAYPYSSSPSFGQSASFGFGRTSNTNTPAFPSTHHNGGMRDSYILSRLRPHISEFVAACFSYLPYFSSLAPPSQSASSHSTALQTLHKDKSHPSETFSFLCTVTNHIVSQPPLAQSELVQQLFPRLSEEWKAWIIKVDEVVNRSGGMFGSETVQGWGRALDEMADAKLGDGSAVMRMTRDLWVSKVGWLIGRTVSNLVPTCMHHRAFGLLPSNTSFTAVLKAAAGRAWTRSASNSQKSPARGVSKPLLKPPEISLVRYLQRREVPAAGGTQKAPCVPSHCSFPSTSALYFDPDAVGDSDWWPPPDQSCSDEASFKLDHSERPRYWDDTSIVGTPLGSSTQKALTPHFPLAKNYNTLHQNLLRLIHSRHPPPSLPALMDYHDLHPGFRSTRSYNLLISLAIRTASYGTARWLLDSMRAERVPGNLETWKLKVRWMVQSGMWNKAWRQAMDISPRTRTRTKDGDKVIFKVTNALPLPIWIEFFRTLKYGTTRIRSRRRRTSTPNTQAPSVPTPSDSAPSDSLHLYSTRYHTLMNNRPTVVPHDLSSTPPKAIYHTVWIMLNVGQSDTALSLSKSYFASLPPQISRSWYRICLDILHLNIAKGSSQQGLRRLYESRRAMVSLISAYPTLQPTSTTLFLLLAPLYRAKRCGTVAANTLRAFKSLYGSRTEDRRVRRRVALLALKEGRRDIVQKMLDRERGARWAHATWRLTERVTGTAAKPRSHLKDNLVYPWKPATATLLLRTNKVASAQGPFEPLALGTCPYSCPLFMINVSRYRDLSGDPTDLPFDTFLHLLEIASGKMDLLNKIAAALYNAVVASVRAIAPGVVRKHPFAVCKTKTLSP
ncbi:hypothetical protein DXG01_000286 [Tephrocybe rancida]|nr:hypothetical protein DXG01_000286 [Tephrocybe rancida]